MLRVLRGPEGGAAFEEVTALEWRVRSESDRRGVRLGGAGASAASGTMGERRSSGVLPGTVQLPPSGEPILLGVDAPVTGGYAWVAQVVGSMQQITEPAGARSATCSATPSEAPPEMPVKMPSSSARRRDQAIASGPAIGSTSS